VVCQLGRRVGRIGTRPDSAGGDGTQDHQGVVDLRTSAPIQTALKWVETDIVEGVNQKRVPCLEPSILQSLYDLPNVFSTLDAREGARGIVAGDIYLAVSTAVRIRRVLSTYDLLQVISRLIEHPREDVDIGIIDLSFRLKESGCHG
jgi:hypothetical protein